MLFAFAFCAVLLWKLVEVEGNIQISVGVSDFPNANTRWLLYLTSPQWRPGGGGGMNAVAPADFPAVQLLT